MTAVIPTIQDQYIVYGEMGRLFSSKEDEIIGGGPAGTGKSRSNLEYLNYWASEYPGARLLMVRKTRRSLTESGMVTFEQKVMHPAQRVRFKSSMQQYQYPNGSILAVGGLDKPEKILSSEWDIIYAQEATELEEKDWEMCSMRLRNGKLPVQQMIGDCNPDKSTHWIKQRARSGKMTMLETKHQDNPVLYNRDGTKTPEGIRYLARLEQLTGVRYARYYLGLWVSSEGMVYEHDWNPSVNLIHARSIPRDWPRYLSIDFGYTNPFVCQWWTVDNDGRLYRYREIYRTKRLVEDHCIDIALASGWYNLLPKSHPRYNVRPADNADPLPREVIGDHDAEDRATFERHLGLYVTPAKKTVRDGIQAVAARMRPAGDGKPRLMLMRDSLVEPDRDLAESKKPTCTEEEMESYIWQQTTAGTKEEPVKADDHGCFVAGTMITTARGDVPIEQIRAGEYVLTRNGYKPVKASGITSFDADVKTVTFSNGTSLTGTGNHPIYLQKQGYIPLRSMRYGDIIEDINSYKERYPLLCQSLQQNQRPLSTRELHSDVILNPLRGQPVTTIAHLAPITSKASDIFIQKYGKMLTDLSQKDLRFTTETEIRSTTLLGTWKLFLKKSIRSGTNFTKIHPAESSCVSMLCQRRERQLKHGTHQKKEGRGIKSLAACRMQMRNINRILASIAINFFSQTICNQDMLAFVQRNVKRMPVETQELTTKPVVASLAVRSLSAINTLRNNIALGSAGLNCSPLENSVNVSIATSHLKQGQQTKNVFAQPHVLTITSGTDKQTVYNLTVENPVGEGEYFANGVLVHNCDCLRYMVAALDLQPSGVSYFPSIWG